MLMRLFQNKAVPTLALFSPAACIGYIVTAAVMFSEQSALQKLGIPAATVGLAPSIPLSILGYQVKKIPKGWRVDVLNETSSKGKCYNYQIKDRTDQTLLTYADSENVSHPIMALFQAGKKCDQIEATSHRGEVTSFVPGSMGFSLDTHKLLDGPRLRELEMANGMMPLEEDVKELAKRADRVKREAKEVVEEADGIISGRNLSL